MGVTYLHTGFETYFVLHAQHLHEHLPYLPYQPYTTRRCRSNHISNPSFDAIVKGTRDDAIS